MAEKIGGWLALLFLLLVTASFLMFVSAIFAPFHSYETILIKCGSFYGNDQCIQLYPAESQFTTEKIDSTLANEPFRIVKCSENPDSWVQVGHCLKMLERNGCEQLESDIENNTYYLLYKCPTR